MKKNLFYVCAISAFVLGGLSSCVDNNETPDSGNGTGSKAEAYAAINVTIPNGGSTRGLEDGDGYETGSADEYKVNNVTLYFFNKFELDGDGNATATATNEGNATCVQQTTINSFPQVSEDAGKNIVYTSVVTKLAVGVYRVYAVVNGTISGVTTTTTEAAFKASLNSITAAIGSTVPASGLLMASRTVTGINTSAPCVEAEIKAENNANNPAPIIFAVERIVGKVEIKESTAASYTLTTTDGNDVDYAKVSVDEFTVINQSKDFNYFRQTGKFAVGTKTLETDGRGFSDLAASDASFDNYILDPKTMTKSDITAENATKLAALFNNPLNSTYTYAAVPTISAEPTEPNFAKVYTYENVLFKDQQFEGYSTGVIYKASVTPLNLTYMDGADVKTTDVEAEITAKKGANFFFHSGRFYTTIAALNKSGIDIVVNGASLTDLQLAAAITSPTTANPSLATIKAAFADLNLKYLQGGKCYYKYWIKHHGTGTPEAVNKMQPMEFSVVRNNLYRIQVQGIKAIGEDSDNENNPEDPDKKNEVYLMVTMSVKPWVLRDTQIILQ